MASRRGPLVDGTDGSDFGHREKVATHYQISVASKNFLRKGIFVHLLLGTLMVLKLVPYLLDSLNIFILHLEELEIPEPLTWELWWLVGCCSSFVGLNAIKKNNSTLLQAYIGMINLLSTVPVVLALMTHSADFYTFCSSDDPDNIARWRGYPLAVLWYVFLAVAVQVHVFSLYYAFRLLGAWKTRSKSH